MRSIKPGRGPSMMSGVVGIFMICFGIFWTITVLNVSPFFALFGIAWTLIAIVITIYNFKNATSKNRYSSFDITDSNEESDPLNDRFGNNPKNIIKEDKGKYCPYCGEKLNDDFKFCRYCGRKLPDDN